MDTIIKHVLAGGIKMLIGSDWWGKVGSTVADLAKADLSGAQKKDMAVTTLKEMGWNLASWALNLAVEVAVAVLTKKMDDLAA